MALGRAIAVRQTPASGASTLTYLLADHLGATVGTLDASGNVVSTQRYWPYGATRSGGITQSDKLYTGQQREETGARQDATNALGLYFYHARFYSTTTGRFVSADTIADGLNRYSYARDNPLRYSDPPGLDAVAYRGAGNHCEGHRSGCADF